MRTSATTSSPLLRLAVIFLIAAGHTLAQNVPLAPANHVLDSSRLLSPLARQQIAKTLLDEQHQAGISLYVAIFSSPAEPVEKIAGRLAESWIGGGRGAVIVIAANTRSAGAVPSLNFQRSMGRAALTQHFLLGAKSSLIRGEFDSAIPAGIDSVLSAIRENQRHLTAHIGLSRGWIIVIACAVLVVGALFLVLCVRIWKRSNLFDRSYRFAAAAPILRFGGTQSGGLMATILFNDPK